MSSGMGGQEPPLIHAKLIRLHQYWCERRGSRDFPARADIDPLDFSYALGDIALVDVFGDPPQFHFRLFGTSIVQHTGYDLTGKTVDDIPEAQYREYIRQAFGQAVEARRPVSAIRDLFVDGRPRRYEVLYLPLSQDGVVINMLLVATAYLD